jgi:ferredoxin
VKITVDPDLCEANAVCCGLAPEVFSLDDDEQLQILIPEPPAELADRVAKAVSRCPRNALSILD